MKIRFLALILSLLLLAVWAHAADDTKVIDRIVAVVDNDVILESELTQYVQFSVGSQQTLESMRPAELDSLRSAILADLINQKVLLAKARADTIKVEDRVIDAELDNRIKNLTEQAGGTERLEQYYGMPLARIKRQFRPLVEEGLLIEKLKQEKLKNVHVSPSEVQRFWESYKDSIPPLKDAVRIAHILLKDSVSQASVDYALSRADSLRKQIQAGTITFEEAASRFSEDPASAAKGGRLGQTSRGDLVPEYEAVAYALEPGQVSQPVLSSFGVHIIRLNERVGEKINTSHILFKVTPTDADRALTQARADSIIAAVQGGADWVKLVSEYSIDIKTAGRGGDLGWFNPDELPDDFK